jgi:hypothetical protein
MALELFGTLGSMTDEQFPTTEYFRTARGLIVQLSATSGSGPLISRLGWPFKPMARRSSGLRSPKLAGEYYVWSCCLTN